MLRRDISSLLISKSEEQDYVQHRCRETDTGSDSEQLR
jgi:hypothetical protein